MCMNRCREERKRLIKEIRNQRITSVEEQHIYAIWAADYRVIYYYKVNYLYKVDREDVTYRVNRDFLTGLRRCGGMR